MLQLARIFTFLLGCTYCHGTQAAPVAVGHVNYKDLSLIKGETFRPTFLKNNLGTNEYVLIIRGGKLYEDGKVLTSDDRLIEEVTMLGWGQSIDKHHLLRLQKEPNSPKYEKFNGKIAVVSSAGAENYYHWMFQILPRIKILKESGVSFDKLYFYELNKPYQFETLKELAIQESDIIVGKPDHIIVSQELIVPSIPVWIAKGKSFSPWVIEYLKSNLLAQSDTQNFPDKIFISRQKASLRNIVNEDALVEELVKKGYQRVFLEDYSVKDQALMFSQVKEVIGVHGSGLTNLLFCTPGTKIIEIDPFDGHRGPYSLLAQEMQLHYQQLETSAEDLSDDQRNQEDVFVPVDKLLALLRP